MRILRSFALSALVLAGALSCGSNDTVTPTTGGPYDAVPVTSRVQINGLEGPVDVVRDKYGMVHIRATSIKDALRVEGYQVARDRTVQLELIRRSATGRIAELFGDDIQTLVDDDIAMRTVGLARTAKAMLDQASPELKSWLEAYADGISQFNARAATGEEELPGGMIGLSQSAFAPWTAIDVLAVGRLQAFNLGYTADEEIAQTDFVEAARTKFLANAANPDHAKRAGTLLDMLRFAPIENATPLTAFPNDAAGTLSYTPKSTKPAAPARVRDQRTSPEALTAARAFNHAIGEVRRFWGEKGFTGSNNWIVGPSRSETGHAMLASDPHLSLSAPSVFWMVHVTVEPKDPQQRLNFAGLSFPGLPGIILGFNDNVAWGATTADYDVTDVYEETLTPDAQGVVFRGANVPFEKIHETINVARSAPVEYDVLVVPHHGPIVPKIVDHKVVPPSGQKALSIKWTGHAATKDLDAVFGLLKAKNVDDARIALNSFAIGAQNWVVADTGGNIFYTTHSLIPKRDRAAYTWDPNTFTGRIPCFVLPGDGSAEWTGAFLEDAFIPHVKNPAKGYLATANSEQVGTTLDNDPTNDVLPNGEPMYMAAWHDVGFRLARIQQRIEEKPKLSLADLASIQADARSATGSKLAPKLLETIAHAKEEAAAPGTRKDIQALVASDRYKNANIAEIEDLLTKWGAEGNYDAASGMDPATNQAAADPREAMASRATTIFNVWLARAVRATFQDEISFLGVGAPFDLRKSFMDIVTADKTKLKTYDATLGDSILFDDLATPGVVETRDERFLLSLLDAVDFLRGRLGADTQQWRWGRLHTIRFTALIPLWKTLSIPADPDPIFPNGFPRHGDGYNVDVAGYGLPGALDANTSFAYSHGPTQRLVIDMDPAGPVARNALPGGNVWDSRSDHFRDEAERWRKNENRPVPFKISDVVSEAEGRVVYQSLAP